MSADEHQRLQVRDAVAADVPAIVRLVNAAYRQPGATPGWTDERHLLEGPRTDADAILADLDRGRFLLMSMDAKAPILGCVRITEAPDAAWSLSTIAVDPSRQAMGLGRALMAEVERQARQAGCVLLRMTVVQLRQSLIAWYGRRAFQPTGRNMAFPYDDPTVGRPLRDDLMLIELEKLLRP